MPLDYGAAALVAARRYCGWVVSPPETVVVTVVRPGGRVLSLPSLFITGVDSVVEDGVSLDVADLLVSGETGQLEKRSGACWTSTGVVEVTFTHGFVEAPDFDVAVAQAAAALEAAGARTDSALKRKKVNNVEYEWFEAASSFLNHSLLAPYRILPAP